MNAQLHSIGVCIELVDVRVRSAMADRLTEDRCTRNCGERIISRSNTVEGADVPSGYCSVELKDARICVKERQIYIFH